MKNQEMIAREAHAQARNISKSVFGKSETNVESEEYAREKTRKM